ncbi:hypothetical protein [Coleofasciculus sp. G2-EDA-02]|uniref:hypothetical protein n=1 Tax=Coleofasciculus sp. G2-EDA-02 TaxID=3069529 RepID=UPI00330359F5
MASSERVIFGFLMGGSSNGAKTEIGWCDRLFDPTFYRNRGICDQLIPETK